MEYLPRSGITYLGQCRSKLIGFRPLKTPRTKPTFTKTKSPDKIEG